MSKSDKDIESVPDTTQPALEDEDAMIAALEDDKSAPFTAFREQRIQQLHEEHARAKQLISEGYGQYPELKEEKALMDLITKSELIVVHFSKADFSRCGEMDIHLEALASRHYGTRFAKIYVENSPFLVMKMCIKVLPCILCWKNGKNVDRIVGFEGLGDTPDSFTTDDLEQRLMSSGIIRRNKLEGFNNTGENMQSHDNE
ncbi:Thioredoxin domain-containing protein plp1 [Golovinomyces cichoracearum]|uniref:Thioredoxin domain-containing protein plp1 n=1 Tax=Golovinomyces cichoracearum TaxID=62708 RepID=A0A420HDF6_9PEZI|nr:Thioredoxin domain-containing protein plp1 [Golovinomyces cichoracearum]RKF55403.1 Thioredoxin domain-containing protein plp1 [Golovinomyces cichoracearum]RKF81173.1 Thioredoxin domain-containing protein plp1 [Golovinomyces cichoracearum]